MSRSDRLKVALSKSKKALLNEPHMFPLEWIIEQLEYLLSVEEGAEHDYSRLKDMKIGWIATRELDGFQDKDLIQLLCLISDEVKDIMQEKGAT